MNSKSLYLRLLRHVKPHRRIFFLALFGMVLTALTEPAMPALLKPLLDDGFVEKDKQMIMLIPVLLILLAVVRGLATFIASVGMTWVAAALVMDLRRDMFHRLLSLPAGCFDGHSTGVLLSKFSYDVTRVMRAATDTLVILVRDSLAVIGLLAWMFYLNWQLSLLVFTVMPFIALVVRFTGKKMRAMNSALQERMGNMTRILEEVISGHKLVKIFAGQDYENRRFAETNKTVRDYEVKLQAFSNAGVFIVQLLTATALALIIYTATRLAGQDNISVGGFVSLFTAMGMLFSPIKRLTKVNEQLQQGLAAAQSVFDLTDQMPEADTGRLAAPPRLQGEVEIRGLSFSYGETAKPVLQEIDLHIKAGETLALVGASGSGKSTLANLLPRFYPLEDGAILLDGTDIRDFKLADLRRNIALVSQEVVLFNDSVAANIAYGGIAGASEEEVIAAAKAAYAWEFIQAMPKGLQTVIGERGVKLSGGQRQRLAIARALLKDAPLLIFDEATSALDNESERYVQMSLEKLKQGRTTIIIAHRLSTIENADRIVVMEQGCIRESGSHTELMRQNGLYAKLYQAQSF